MAIGETTRDTTRAPSTSRGMSLATRESLSGYLFISPWIIGFIAFTALPMLASLYLSLTDFDPRRPEAIHFIGLANYAKMTTDPNLLNSLGVTLRFGIIVVPLTMAFALGVAMLVNHPRLLGRNFFRSLFYMPMQIPIVASTLVWIGMLNASTGWLDLGLRAMGLPAPDWLNSAIWVTPALALMGIWGIGNMMLIFLAGLQGVPTELYEAARVDGAGRWASFRRITLPMISPVIFYNAIIALIGTFQYFTQAYIVSNGRGDPAGATLFYNLNLYLEGFGYYQMGYASALAWLLFVIVLTITVVLFRLGGKWVYEAGGVR